jgi:hypothetical protein
MFPVLRPFLNKGGAGHYISRQETVDRLVPLAEQHNALLRAYGDALAGLRDESAKRQLAALPPTLRTHLAKLNETIYSAGGKAPLGAGEGGTDGTDGERLYRVLDLERAYHRALTEEVDAVHHQERTRAILKHLARGSGERLEAVRTVTNRIPRPAGY